MTDTRYAKARAIYNEVKRPGKRVLTLPEIQRVIEAHEESTVEARDTRVRELETQLVDAHDPVTPEQRAELDAIRDGAEE